MSCTGEKPSEPAHRPLWFAPTVDTLPDRTEENEPQEWHVQTSEQLDTLLDMRYGVDIMSGDTLRLKADTLFTLVKKLYPKIHNMNLVFIGDSPRPTIKTTWDDFGTVLEFGDNDQSKRFEFRNIKLDWSSENQSGAFIKLTTYDEALFEDVFGSLGGGHLAVFAVNDTFRDCEFRSAGNSLVLKPYSSSSDIVLNNTDLTLEDPYNTNYALHVPFDQKAASLVISGSQFIGPGTSYFMRAFGQNQTGGGATAIPITVDGNHFLGLYDLYADGPTGLSDAVTFNVDYSDNEVTIGTCPGYEENEGVTVAMGDYDWKWNGESVDHDYLYYSIGQISNVAHAKKYCDGKHWVIAAFSLSGDTAEVFHEFMEPTVNYGSISGSLDSTAVVCWDSAQEKWIAELNVPATCGNKTCPVYWAATVTFCDSTGTSTEQTWRYPTPQSPCKDPLICD